MNIRRGVAMLIALMTMTVLIAGITIIAQVKTTDRLIEMRADDMVHTQDIFRVADVPIRTWLEEQASSAVVAPAVFTPMIFIADDEIMLGDQAVRVRITAWDQYGMIPRNSDELRISLGSDVDTAWQDASYPGLDLSTTQPTVFPSREHPAAMGGLFATHNPWPTRSGTTRSRSGAVININTAPVRLIEDIFQIFNLGDPSNIFEKRALGELAIFTLSAQDAKQVSVRLVSISRVWSFRTDVWIGTMRQSNWCVYSNQGGHWRLVQRVGIDDD